MKQVLVIDEIGKMELLSDKFKKEVENAFGKSEVPILATIPIQKGRSLPTVDAIRNLPNCRIFVVNDGSPVSIPIHKSSHLFLGRQDEPKHLSRRHCFIFKFSMTLH